jgi:hypothetical protein
MSDVKEQAMVSTIISAGAPTILTEIFYDFH